MEFYRLNIYLHRYVSTDRGTGTNWDIGTVPAFFDNVLIANVTISPARI